MTHTEIFDKGFFEKLNTMKLSLNMRLSQGMSGVRKSSARGTSVEFSDFREYMQGDDIRRIDWNVYGRTDKLYIKQFMEEKEGVFNLFVDTSKSMDFGEERKSKMALQIAGALSYMILNNLDRVYVNSMHENFLTRGKGVTGGSAFSYILDELSRMEFDGGTSLSKSILSRQMAPGGVSVIISDFFDYDGIEEAVKYLRYRKQTIVLIQILAREEMEISYEGTLKLIDMETRDSLRITMSRKTVEAYQEKLQELQRELKRISSKYGASYIFIPSDEPLLSAMLYGMRSVLTAK